ncbi:MAG TPA: SdrD B-like domain-containing protein [Candidatus Limnocylindrales bacterium]|nr:SdrD B-like domain-containing protein [Candidatus Limnocylindrales bacterium]
MKPLPSSRLLLMLTFLTLATSPTRAGAQYLYLDLNGDSLNTSSDVLSSLVPVNVGVYLRTDRNRDGSTAACDSGSGQLSIGSVEFILRATGGSVTWGTLVPGPYLSEVVRTAQSATDFYAGFFDSTGVVLPPGRYRIGTLPVTATAGTPLLYFATSTPLSGSYLTSFGSRCRGLDGDNTMKLGRDWFDADGTFGALLATVSGKVFKDSNSISSGNCALDPGEVGMPGWPVTLNPGGQTILTSFGGDYQFVNVLPGVYSIQVSPPSGWVQTCPSGGAAQSVIVAPSQTYPGLNFGVRPADLPPALTPIPPHTGAEGLVTNVPLTATDLDNSSVSFSLVSGPSFASVTTTGLKTGNLRFAPQPGDAGTYTIQVAASDGLLGSQRSAQVNVLSVTGVSQAEAAARPALIAPNPMNPSGTLSFTTQHAGWIRVVLYDVQGRRVRGLVEDPRSPAGYHEIPIDGRDDAGRALPTGVYFFKLDTAEGPQIGRAVVLK